MLKWEKMARTVHGDGSSEIRYEAKGSRYAIEARKKMIPHANGIGVWSHTSYFLIDTETKEEREFWRQKDAKAAAEK